MKKFLQTIFSIRNDKNHKIITILGIKIKLYNRNAVLKSISKEIKLIKKNISDIHKMFDLRIKEKPWQNLKHALADISANETAEFIIHNNMLNIPTFSNRLDLHTHALNFVEKEGLYLEFGVYVGKSINHIAKQKPNEKIYGFDCFEGLPESWYGDYTEGKFKLEKLPEVEPNVELVVGYFDDTLPKFVQEHGDFDVAYLNIDCDLYSSTKTIFDSLKGHISRGTVIYFDEYFNYPGWQQHEYKAFMEFLEETGFSFEYLGYVYNKEKVAVRIV